MLRNAFFACSLMLLMRPCASFGAPEDYFRIQVVDSSTSRGIPLAKLSTTNGITCYTDSSGQVAFNEPGWMARDVFFNVESPGYSFEKDALGIPGKTLKTTPGTSATLIMLRQNIAQRLYRITGTGIYRDTVLLGDKPPISEPLANCSVVGQDSAQAIIYHGSVFWLWGDTGRMGYPLGNFRTTCAISDLPGKGGLDPDTGINIHYFAHDDFVKSMIPFKDGSIFWVSALTAVPGADGRERLVAMSSSVNSSMQTLGRTLVQFNDENQEFEKIRDVPLDALASPNGHPFPLKDGETNYVVFPGATRFLRAKADYASVIDLHSYEAYTCLKEGSHFDGAAAQLDRTPDGALRYEWKKNTAPIGQEELQKLEKSGAIKHDERWIRLEDANSTHTVIYHEGSICWNEWRKKWVMIFCEAGGTSFLGEIWYAEATSPTGPWVLARKIATHPAYSFYNPVQHPFFAKDGGRVIYFEGTYTMTFSETRIPVPRYDYNQLMYKLELDDPRLGLAPDGLKRK